MRPKPHWRWLLLSGLIGGAFLLLALRDVDLAATWRSLRTSDPGWSAAAWVAGLAFMAIKAERWRWLLQPVEPFGFGVLHRAVYAGTAANLIVPHSGEVLRATLLGLRAHRPASPILTTIGVERLLDFAALVAWVALGLLLDPAASAWLWSAGAVGLAMVALGLLVVWIALDPSPRTVAAMRALAQRLPKRIGPWLEMQLRRGVTGLASCRQPRQLLWVGLLSLAQWGAIVAAVWCSAQAVGVALPASGAVVIFALTVVGLTLPAPPVQVGATQLAFYVAFDWHGANADAALAASIVYTVFVLVSMLIGGAVCSAFGPWRRGHAAAMHGSPPA